MAKSGEFYTFDEVVRQLKIDENKLKRLVSEGEISAFREGDVMKFKRSEIDKISSKGGGSETSETVLSEITLEDEAPAFEESGETLTDDLVFESTGTEDQVEIGSAGAPVEEISSQDTFIEEPGAADEVGMTTEPIDLSADLTQEVEEEEIEEVDAPTVRRTRPAAAARGRATEQAGSPGITFALVVSAILVLLALAVGWKAGNNELGTDRMSDGSVFRSISKLFYDNLGSKEQVNKSINATTEPVRLEWQRTVKPTGGGEGG